MFRMLDVLAQALEVPTPDRPQHHSSTEQLAERAGQEPREAQVLGPLETGALSTVEGMETERAGAGDDAGEGRFGTTADAVTVEGVDGVKVSLSWVWLPEESRTERRKVSMRSISGTGV